MQETPVSLLLRLRTRDEAAWKRFVELYTPLLYLWACRFGLVGEDAADLVQDVLAILVQKMPGFEYEPGKKFRGFLRTLIENRWRDLLRRRVARPELAGVDLNAVTAPPESDFAEKEYRAYILARATRIMEADFQPETWRAFWALVVDERSGADVAAEMGQTVAAVYQARARVLRRLRQELAGLLE